MDRGPFSGFGPCRGKPSNRNRSFRSKLPAGKQPADVDPSTRETCLKSGKSCRQAQLAAHFDFDREQLVEHVVSVVRAAVVERFSDVGRRARGAPLRLEVAAETIKSTETFDGGEGKEIGVWLLHR